MMTEYKCIEIEKRIENTEELLNRLAQKGWKLVCSYAYEGRYLIFEREVEE